MDDKTEVELLNEIEKWKDAQNLPTKTNEIMVASIESFFKVKK